MKTKISLMTMAFVMVFFVCVSYATELTDVIFIVETSDTMREADPGHEVMSAIAQFVSDAGESRVGVIGFSSHTVTLPLTLLDSETAVAAKRAAIFGIAYHGEHADIIPALQTASHMLNDAHNPIVFLVTSNNRQTSYPSMRVPVHSIIVDETTNLRALPGLFSGMFDAHSPSPTPEPTPEPTPTPSPTPEPTPPPELTPELTPEPTPEPTPEFQIPPIHEWPEDYFDDWQDEIIEEEEEEEEADDYETLPYEEPPPPDDPSYTILVFLAIISGAVATFSVARFIRVVV